MKHLKISKCAQCPYIRIGSIASNTKSPETKVFCSGLPLDEGPITDSSKILDNCPLEDCPKEISFEPLDTPFPCSKCGCCCELVACPQFDTETRLCSCYEYRPMICRVDAVSDLMDKRIDPALWRKANMEMCAKFQEAKRAHDAV